jgi:transcriptional regulator of arginine metabolism
MNGRPERLKAIRHIITDHKVESQEHLQQLLEEKDVKVTQATLSRDLKVLKVGKVPDVTGGYYYVLSENEGENTRSLVEDFKRGFLSMGFSGNLGIIHTLAGHADSVAIALDKLEVEGILGTIAGDDTILIILREGTDRAALVPRLEEHMGPLEVEP